MNWILGIILAVCIGISLGLIGGGGSILALPILKYVMGVETKSAIAMTLIIVGIVSAIGAISHFKQGNVNLKTAALFSPAAMLGAYLGARITSLSIITPTIQLIGFATIMLLAAFLMIRKSSRKLNNQSMGNLKGSFEKDKFDKDKFDKDDLQDSFDKYKFEKNKFYKDKFYKDKFDYQPQDAYRLLLAPLEGLVVGIITGFVGVGGGFMIIPALVLLGKTPMKEAVGTSLLIITFKSIAGFAGYFGQVAIDLNLIIIFTLAACLGSISGAYLSNFVQPKQLEKSFGYFIIAVAIFILIKR